MKAVAFSQFNAKFFSNSNSNNMNTEKELEDLRDKLHVLNVFAGAKDYAGTLEVVKNLQSENQTLKAEIAQMKAKQLETEHNEIISLVEESIKTGRIDVVAKDSFISACKNIGLAESKKLISGLKPAMNFIEHSEERPDEGNEEKDEAEITSKIHNLFKKGAAK